MDRIIFEGAASLSVSGEGTRVGSMSIPDEAEGSKVTVENGADIDEMQVESEGTEIEISEGSQVKVIHVKADGTKINGEGAAKIIVDPGVEEPQVEGYSQVGSTATVENSMAFSNALSRNDVNTILMKSGRFELVDKHLDITRKLIIKGEEGVVVYGTISIKMDNVTLDGLAIDAVGTYDLTGYYSAVLINADGNPQNISVINNTIQQDYNGITVLKACKAVITGNTIISAEKSSFATRGIQIGNTPEIGGTAAEAVNIITILEDNNISGNIYNGMLNQGVGIYIRSSAVASQAEAEILGAELSTNNILYAGNEIEYWVASKAPGEFEIWADAEGDQFNAVKSINLAASINEMKQAVEYYYSDLNLTQYNTLTSDLKYELCRKIFNDRPLGGYSDISDIQNTINGWFDRDTSNFYVKIGYSGDGRGSNPYGTIKSALDNIDSGGTINICEGIYYEDEFEITKSMTVKGENYRDEDGNYITKTIVKVSIPGSSTIVYVHNCEDVNIQWMTFDRAGDDGEEGEAGIAVLFHGPCDFNSSSVSNCRVIGEPGPEGTNQFCALEALNFAHNIIFERNIVEGFHSGGYSAAIGNIWPCEYIIIRDNIIDGLGVGENGILGIALGSSEVRGNIIKNCKYGVYCNQSELIVEGNTIYDNYVGLGFDLNANEGRINNNKVYDNTIELALEYLSPGIEDFDARYYN